MRPPAAVIGAGFTHSPMPGIVEEPPRKFLAGILLAGRRDVGMGEHAVGAECGGG